MSVAHFGPPGELPDADLRSASLVDADDVAALLSELGYPATGRTPPAHPQHLDNDRQALVVARWTAWSRLVALDFMYYLPLDTVTCRITALVVTSSARGRAWAGSCCARPSAAPGPRRGPAGADGSQRTDAHAFYKACGFSDGTLRFIKRLGRLTAVRGRRPGLKPWHGAADWRWSRLERFYGRLTGWSRLERSTGSVAAGRRQRRPAPRSDGALPHGPVRGRRRIAAASGSLRHRIATRSGSPS